MDWFTILTRGFWCGWAAFGFGVLFNTPTRSLLPIWISGCVAGLIKFSALSPIVGLGVIVSSFLASLGANSVAIPLCKWRDVPLVVIAIPSIIPLVPGAFAYRAMMGLMKLTRHVPQDYSNMIADTVYNGVMALFIVIAITFGLVIPVMIIGARPLKGPA
jgi:uncharacterized membrane protein YjjB (DUF3815 family)